MNSILKIEKKGRVPIPYIGKVERLPNVRKGGKRYVDPSENVTRKIRILYSDKMLLR